MLIRNIVCFYLLFIPVFLMAQMSPPAPYSSNIKLNSVRVWGAKAPESNPFALPLRPLNDVLQQTQYYDGLGRPLQTVVKKGSLKTGSNGVDLVIPVVYDEYGREIYKYLPFVANNTGGNASISDGVFKRNPFQQQAAFASAQYSGETFYYSQTNYESSPLNRVEKIMSAGNSWVGANRGISKQTTFNSVAETNVKVWRINAAAGSLPYVTGVYNTGTLARNATYDEHNSVSLEYIDQSGKIVLKSTDLGVEKLLTFYVYDDFGNLRCVIPPKAVTAVQSNWTMTQAVMNELCFRYEYDERNRMIIKKVPGAGEEWIVYDGRNRPVLAIDSLRRSLSPVRWLYTQYDGLNRPVGTGLWNNSQDRTFHKTQAENSTSYPNLSGQTYEELTWNYYDDYTWAASLPTAIKDFDISYASTYLQTASNTVWPYAQAVQPSTGIKGLVTGNKVKVLDSSPAQVLAIVTFYDEKGRVIQVRSQNVTGGVDVVTTQYTWNGQPLVVVQKQEKAGTNSQTHIIVTKMAYDSLGRVLTIKKTVSSTIGGNTITKSEQILVSNEYDALGQLKKKVLGDPLVDSISYDYNIRGWLLGANRAYAKDAHQNNYFGFDLGYDKTANGLIGNQSYTTTQYNGNITGTVWKSKGDGEKRKYDFGYDAANRVLKADFTQYTGTTFNLAAGIDFTMKDMSYDPNGNILSMTQRGWKLGGSTIIDSLLYTYENSNKLKNVLDRNNDPQTKLGDFRSSSLYMGSLGGTKNTTATDYIYDGNGNMIRDRNKDIGDATNNGITYNQMNLPQVVTVHTTGGAVKGTITYTYDAVGNKLKKTVQETGQPAKTTLYLGGMVYENDTLQFIGHEEGRLRYAKQYYVNGSSEYKYIYDYFLKDHLGNVRMVLTEQKDTAVYMATMEAAYRSKENALFANIPQTSFPKISVPGEYPVDGTTNPNDSLARVNGSNKKVGPALVLRVMSGDQVDIAVKSFYRSGGTAGPTSDPVADILSALAGGIVGTAGEAKGTLSQLNNPGTSPLVGILNSFRTTNNTTPPSKPKAYLNWILLDEQLKNVTTISNAIVVGDPDAIRPLSPTTLTIPKNGFLYIYVSNETQNWDVFFDNLRVEHRPGAMLEETHYYPFGLTMAGISTKAIKPNYTENKKKFVGQDLETDLDWSMYQFRYRSHDPQLGRFIQIDPLASGFPHNSTYAYAENRPIDGIDLEGKEFWRTVGNMVGDRANASTYWAAYKAVKVAQYTGSLNAAYRSSTGQSEQPSTPAPPPVQNAQASLNKINDQVQIAQPALDVLDATATLASITPIGEAGAPVSLMTKVGGTTVRGAVMAGEELMAVQGGSGTLAGGKTIGLGLDADLAFHRGTGAITYKGAGWQEAGLTKVDWGRASMDNYSFRQSFKEVAENAGAIKFNVTNFNPVYSNPGITNFEFNYILNNPALLQKTTFIQNGTQVFWNGTKFVK